MHYYLALYVTKVLSVFVLLTHLGLAVLLVCFLLRKLPAFSGIWIKARTEIERYGLWLSLLIPATAVLMSLFYSEVADFAPCLLCWWQRIFIYPQAFIAAIALKRKDLAAVLYTLPLTAIGFLIAAYHYAIQIQETYGGSFLSVIECAAGTEGPACSSYYFLEFGYITIPQMSLTAFALLLVVQGILLAKLRRERFKPDGGSR